ncbi:hypothetical protein POTOM_052702 [Populus tomentosa]|uniref:Uncharacterized protein n=1 Tax=Populus tomentosa TaxID=118781 RepID=A0A8X7Y0M4_POPTO|nr:hypothetical protein POTOM_052702 [Populus tomentosa]
MGWFWWRRLPSFIPINYMASNLINNNNKGSIEVVKKSSRQLIERYYSRMTLDFYTNKKALEELQAEERERRMDFVPEVSAIKSDQIEVDKETMDMLASLGKSCFPGLVQVDPVAIPVTQFGFGRGGPGGFVRRG